MKYCRFKLLKMVISNPKTLSSTLQNNFSLRILLFDQGFDTNKHKFSEGLSKPSTTTTGKGHYGRDRLTLQEAGDGPLFP